MPERAGPGSAVPWPDRGPGLGGGALLSLPVKMVAVLYDRVGQGVAVSCPPL